MKVKELLNELVMSEKEVAEEKEVISVISYEGNFGHF